MAIIPYHDDLLKMVESNEITAEQVKILTAMQYLIAFL